jgi:IclR family KDG regulon transcriptional repressor
MKPEPTLYKSVTRIADILLCLVNGINTVTEIADFCQLSKSTVSRLLKTLSQSNFIVQDPLNRRYYLGRLMAQFSSNPYVIHKYLVVSSIKEMLRLREISRETVILSILIGIQYMNLHQINSEHELRITADGKMQGPMLLGATTKVLFSQVNNEELELALKYFEIDRQEGSSKIDKEVFIEQLIQIKQQGYAITYGEKIPGVMGISAPVRNYICPAALSILGPENRLRPKMDLLIEELKASASQVSDFIAGIPNE